MKANIRMGSHSFDVYEILMRPRRFRDIDQSCIFFNGNHKPIKEACR